MKVFFYPWLKVKRAQRESIYSMGGVVMGVSGAGSRRRAGDFGRGCGQVLLWMQRFRYFVCSLFVRERRGWLRQIGEEEDRHADDAMTSSTSAHPARHAGPYASESPRAPVHPSLTRLHTYPQDTKHRPARVND
jgi:hypothetical protein